MSNKPMITSLHNPRVKRTAKLRNHRARKATGQFVIDGSREILRALQADVNVAELYVCSESTGRPESQQILRHAERMGIEQVSVSRSVFEKLAFGQRSEGLVAVANLPAVAWQTWPLPENPLIIVLEQVEKPGNLGGVLRTADAVGAAAVLVADPAADIYSPNTIRASLGAVFTVPVGAATSSAILDWLRERAIRLFAARVEGATCYSDADLTGPSALILGSEACGLSERWASADIVPISLPMRGAVDSLNVSVTAAVLMYEALRQRGGASHEE
jgi:TrmH family RNA methyltransferase